MASRASRKIDVTPTKSNSTRLRLASPIRAPAAFGKGSGASKSDVHDIVVTKLTDLATPPLMKACASGKTIGDAIITIRKAGGD